MIDRIKSIKGAHLNNGVHLSTVSGVASTKPELVRYFDKKQEAIDIITTKSFQVNPNPGNREPVICEMSPGSFGNSVGLRNPGLEKSLPPLEKLRNEGLRALLNVSVSASNVEDFITLIKAFDNIADSIELNFSCPHAAKGFGASIGCDQNIAAEYVREIRKAYPEQKSALLIKLTPNVEDIGAIAKAVIAEGADGIVAINTVGPEVHIHKESGLPILNNKLGGKGGKSGKWVKQRALEAVKQIRDAIGDGPIIIGMGGMCDAYDVAAMVTAGADAVGLGSVFGTVNQQDWKAYLDTLKDESISLLSGNEIANKASKYIRQDNRMEYTKHKVISVVEHTKDMLILTLSGKLNCQSGEFAFLFIPGKGEKPFSVAHNSPLTFLIRRRGAFTDALFNLKEGDEVYTRGLYGKPLSHEKKKNVLLIGGGSGVAVLPLLCDMIKADDSRVDVLVGTTLEPIGVDGKALFEDFFKNFGTYTVIADEGKPGRVLDHISEHLRSVSDTAVYIVGPEKFMSIAAKKLLELGVSKDDIYLSMERSTMCGIGMCGECVCGDRLACQYGTFFTYTYLLENAKELLG